MALMMIHRRETLSVLRKREREKVDNGGKWMWEGGGSLRLSMLHVWLKCVDRCKGKVMFVLKSPCGTLVKSQRSRVVV